MDKISFKEKRWQKPVYGSVFHFMDEGPPPPLCGSEAIFAIEANTGKAFPALTKDEIPTQACKKCWKRLERRKKKESYDSE